MISNKLYDLALQYEKTKLWNLLSAKEMFAVQFPDGSIGYCSVMGGSAGQFALDVYLGAEALNAYRVASVGIAFSESEMQFREHLLSQDCIQCIFEAAENLRLDDIEAFQQYAHERGISVQERQVYPHFLRYRPYRLPWFLTDETDQSYLCEALSAAIEVAQVLINQEKAELNFAAVTENATLIPLLVQTGHGYVWNTTPLRPPSPIEYPVPGMFNDIAIAKLKRMPRFGMLASEIVRIPEPIQNFENEVPYFPVMMLSISGVTGQFLPTAPVMNYEEDPESLLTYFTTMLLDNGRCPSVIKAHDERTFVFLEEFCAKAGIRLVLEENLPMLDESKESMFSHLNSFDEDEDDDEEPAGSLMSLLQISDSEWLEMQDELLEKMTVLAEQGEFPIGLLESMQRTHARNKARANGENVLDFPIVPKNSYEISVALRSDCYRHIQIPGTATLEELHLAIQNAFEFDNEHCYAFFMDNCEWSTQDAYYGSGAADEEEMIAGEWRLNELGLSVGKKFLYLFDFGDEWRFQCEVLRISVETTEQPVVVCARGEAPNQYRSEGE